MHRCPKEQASRAIARQPRIPQSGRSVRQLSYVSSTHALQRQAPPGSCFGHVPSARLTEKSPSMIFRAFASIRTSSWQVGAAFSSTFDMSGPKQLAERNKHASTPKTENTLKILIRISTLFRNRSFLLILPVRRIQVGEKNRGIFILPRFSLTNRAVWKERPCRRSRTASAREKAPRRKNPGTPRTPAGR